LHDSVVDLLKTQVNLAFPGFFGVFVNFLIQTVDQRVDERSAPFDR
jgi:hypothetical protein